jgi:hypothetical protein
VNTERKTASLFGWLFIATFVLSIPAYFIFYAPVADGGGADELVERHLVGLGDRQQQLEAGLALARFEPRQGALGDAGRGGQLRQGGAPLRAHPLQPGTDVLQHGRDVGCDLHARIEAHRP